MPDRTCYLDDAGEAGKRARDGEGQEDQLVGIEAAEPRGAGRCTDHANLESLDGAPEQDRRRSDDEKGDDGAEMQPAAFDQQRHRCDRIELGRGREVETVWIAPG